MSVKLVPLSFRRTDPPLYTHVIHARVEAGSGRGDGGGSYKLRLTISTSPPHRMSWQYGATPGASRCTPKGCQSEAEHHMTVAWQSVPGDIFAPQTGGKS